MRFFNGKTGDGNNNEGATTPTIVVCWNAAFAVVVGLPILLYMVVNVFSRGEGGGGGGEGEGWWTGWFDAPEEEKWQGIGSFFAYLWGLFVFGFLVWRGNGVLEKQLDIRPLFVAVVLFANLAFLCWLLTATGGQEGEGGEEGAWIAQFAAVPTLTFLLMTLFGVVFSVILHRMLRAGSSSSSSYSLWGDEKTDSVM